MAKFTHILCPIDFSETSVRALNYATVFASRYQARLTVLHVAATFDTSVAPVPDEAGSVPHQASHDDIIARIQVSIAQAGATALNARLLAQAGCAHELIVNCAAAVDADLLVMGTHGLGGFRRLFLGSVTEKVVRTVGCPVLTVPPSAATAPERIVLKKILCPIDYSPSSLRALRYALELGRQSEGCVTVLYALEYVDPEDHLDLSPFDPCHEVVLEGRRRRQQLVDSFRDRLHGQLAGESRVSCEIEEVVAVSRAYKEILQRAAAAATDLIVMGAQGRGGIDLMLYGSTTQHVVRSATCPVLTVRA